MNEEYWDEYQWEDFLQAADKRTQLFQQHIEAYLRDHPPPPDDAPEAEHDAYWERMHRHVDEQMGWIRDEEQDLPKWPEEDPDEEEDSDAEAWKTGLVEEFPEVQDVVHLPIYQQLRAFGTAANNWIESLPDEDRGSAAVEFYTSATLTAAKIASGHAMGYELEMLGGNIAQAKRGLAAANRALDALRLLRDTDLISEEVYRALYEQGHEARNAIGLYVQELREKFERGVD